MGKATVKVKPEEEATLIDLGFKSLAATPHVFSYIRGSFVLERRYNWYNQWYPIEKPLQIPIFTGSFEQVVDFVKFRDT